MRGERSSDVGDSTFAVLLQSDIYIGGGDVAFLAALLPRPRPAVSFVLFDDVQHLQGNRFIKDQMKTTDYDFANIL